MIYLIMPKKGDNCMLYIIKTSSQEEAIRLTGYNEPDVKIWTMVDVELRCILNNSPILVGLLVTKS